MEGRKEVRNVFLILLRGLLEVRKSLLVLDAMAILGGIDASGSRVGSR